MKKQVNLKFRKGRYELIYSENGYLEELSWAGLMTKLFAGWDYDYENEVLTLKLKYGNNILTKQYECEFNPGKISCLAYDIKFNKQIERLFKKIEKDYARFIQEMKELEFEEQIFSIEY